MCHLIKDLQESKQNHLIKEKKMGLLTQKLYRLEVENDESRNFKQENDSNDHSTE